MAPIDTQTQIQIEKQKQKITKSKHTKPAQFLLVNEGIFR